MQRNFKCCKNKEFTNLCCINCLQFFHPSCLDRISEATKIGGSLIYCSILCQTRAIEKDEATENYKSQIESLKTEILKRDEYIKHLKQNSEAFSSDVSLTEENYLSQLKLKESCIEDLRRKNHKLETENRDCLKQLKSASDGMDKVRTQLDEVKSMNGGMLTSIRTLEEENKSLRLGTGGSEYPLMEVTSNLDRRVGMLQSDVKKLFSLFEKQVKISVTDSQDTEKPQVVDQVVASGASAQLVPAAPLQSGSLGGSGAQNGLLPVSGSARDLLAGVTNRDSVLVEQHQEQWHKVNDRKRRKKPASTSERGEDGQVREDHARQSGVRNGAAFPGAHNLKNNDFINVDRSQKWRERIQKTKATRKLGTGSVAGDFVSSKHSSAGDNKIWLYLSRVKLSVSEESIRTYVLEKTKASNSEISLKQCIPKNSNSTYKCFMIGVSPRLKDSVYSEAFWPAGVGYQRFNFSLGRNFLDGKQEKQPIDKN